MSTFTLRPAIEQGADTTTVRLRDGTMCDVEEAGFREVEVLPLENYFFRFYRLRQ